MDQKDIMRIFEETAYVRTGGSPEELRAAEYIAGECKRFGGEAVIEPFAVDMATIEEAIFLADGQEIPCKGYLCAGSAEVEAPLYYLRDTTPQSLSGCRGKIVLVDGYLAGHHPPEPFRLPGEDCAGGRLSGVLDLSGHSGKWRCGLCDL